MGNNRDEMSRGSFKYLVVLVLLTGLFSCRTSSSKSDSDELNARELNANSHEKLSGDESQTSRNALSKLAPLVSGRFIGQANVSGLVYRSTVEVFENKAVVLLDTTGIEPEHVWSAYFPHLQADNTLGVWTGEQLGNGEGRSRINLSFNGSELSAAATVAALTAELFVAFEGSNQIKIDVDGKNSGETVGVQPSTNHIPVQNLGGSYVGVCASRNMTLQLESSPWNDNEQVSSGLISRQNPSGRLGLADANLCGVNDRACIQDFFARGTFRWTRGELQLTTSSETKNCRITATGLSCDGCEFFKEPAALFSNATAAYELNTNEMHQKGDSTPQLIQPFPGQYFGVLHHMKTGLDQPIGLNVKAVPAIAPATEIASSENQNLQAVASLYFGSHGSSEFVAHRFKPIGKEVKGANLVLEGESEGLFAITGWTANEITGTWISKTHGSIGDATLTLNASTPAQDTQAKTLRAISGRYGNANWTFELAANAGISESEHDFYPLRVYGWAKESASTGRRRLISGASYDFYLGQIALRLDDGRIIVGQVSSSGLDLFWPPWPRVGEPMGAQTKMTFNQLSGNQNGTRIGLNSFNSPEAFDSHDVLKQRSTPNLELLDHLFEIPAQP